MPREYRQIVWDDACREACRALARMAMREDLGGGDLAADVTTTALVPADTVGRAAVVSRKAGVVAGLPCIELVLAEYDARLAWKPLVADGACVSLGQVMGTIVGPARSLLIAERTLLNIVGRLSGIATLTRRYVEAVAGTRARIYDTRKTIPCWRLLEKYAVRLGGGCNHRLNLAEGVLIKDNHLALGAAEQGQRKFSAADAVRRAKAQVHAKDAGTIGDGLLIEVELDHLDQLDDVLAARPDIVLLDNMSPHDLQLAVARRDRLGPEVELEASGGVDLGSVAAIARAGVDRISVGALTHSAPWFDIGLDWEEGMTNTQ